MNLLCIITVRYLVASGVTSMDVQQLHASAPTCMVWYSVGEPLLAPKYVFFFVRNLRANGFLDNKIRYLRLDIGIFGYVPPDGCLA